MASWRSWWTAISLALVAQLSCGGESGERPSNAGRAGSSDSAGGDAGQGGSSSSGRSGKAGAAGKASSSGSGGDSGEGGEGASAGTAFGGRAGDGTGGTSPVAGTGTGGAGVSGAAGIAGTGGTGNTAPSNWYCAFTKWGDGNCDCGCGVADKDCEGEGIDECDTCDSAGSCNGGECPGRINPDNPATCTPPPDGWKCPDYAYWDFMYCDCGCGVPDPDCEGEGNAECDKCNLVGSCSGSTNCPGSIDAEDNSTCDIPEGWTCSSRLYLDNYCDCGCGVVDADCSSAASSACENCYNGCAQSYCPGPIDAENNAICTGVPVTWNCAARFYDDGTVCDCGCGAIDPDCADDTGASCDRCDLNGSCSARECPSNIDPDDNRYCVQLAPPEGWLCPSYSYSDGYYCDCGCGVEDIDCRSADIDECDRCNQCGGGCPGRVDPSNTTACVEPPSSWTCDDHYYGDGYSCTCGCGALDPDCADATVASCHHCPDYAGSCSEQYCADINPVDNTRCSATPPAGWTCDPSWYDDRDDACDCGCGVRDLDCPNGTSAVCEHCLGDSCSEPGCATIDPEDNAICVAN